VSTEPGEVQFAFAHASSFRATALFHRGDLADAEADARTALDAVLPLAAEAGYSFTFAILAAVLAERGALAEAIQTLDRASVPDEKPPTYQMALWLDVRARLHIAAGELGQGLAEMLAVGERLEALGVRNPGHVPWRSHAALASLGLGDSETAHRLAWEDVKRARRWGAPRPLGIALRAAGLVEAGAEGLELLRESVDVLAASPARLERAKSLTELGSALRRANQRAEARGHLRDALELAQRCGALPVTERAHAELLATGARPRRLVLTGAASLTPSEHRVARMAAEGRTNREIAQALFVTPKTIEMHLSHVYQKLDIQARSQLARALTA
jgi:DNA-binding CsgD family transcriptional regulator